jgi:6-phosphogluconolactonase
MLEQNVNTNYFLLVGTYTKTQNNGIFIYRFNCYTGQIELVSQTNQVANPSYLCLSKNKQLVYAVNESGHTNGDTVSAFKLNEKTNALTLINKVSTDGIHPCYVSVNKNNTLCFVANYTSGNLACYTIEKDGVLSELKQFIQHEGKSINSQRQNEPHIHAAVFSIDEKYLFVMDLGTDEVVTYKIDIISETKILNLHAKIKINAGSGPRHLIFNSDGTFAYLTLELSGEVAVFSHSEGKLTHTQTVALEAASFKGEHSAADIHLSKDNQYLYATNRGSANSISVFKIESFTGQLTFVQNTSVNGLTPRNFAIDPTGNFVLVANQDSNSITIFKRNEHSGKLILTNESIELDSPVCLKFII